MKSGGLGHIILLAGRRESSEERERAREPNIISSSSTSHSQRIAHHTAVSYISTLFLLLSWVEASK